MENTNTPQTETHKQLIIDTLVNSVLPMLKRPMFEVFEMEFIFSVDNRVYKVKTDQGTFIAKLIPTAFTKSEPMNPQICKSTVLEVIKENKLRPILYFSSNEISIFEYIENDPITIDKQFSQENKLLYLFTLTEYQKMEISEAQKSKMNYGQCMDRYYLESGFKKKLLQVKEELESGKGKEMGLEDDFCEYLLAEIGKVFDPQSLQNRLQDKFEGRGEEGIVFSHNDYRPGNIIMSQSDHKKFILVDFDYSCYNIQGIDALNMLASHLIPQRTENPEDMFTFQLDNIPKDEELKEYLKAYLILLSTDKIQERGTEFITKLRAGDYDIYLDFEKFERFYKEAFEIMYLASRVSLFHVVNSICNNRAVDPILMKVYKGRMQICDYCETKMIEN